MPVTITSTGNAGVYIKSDSGALYIDSFFHPIPDVGGKPHIRGSEAADADIILITHNHYDHLHPEETRDAALATGAVVAGPAKVIHVMAKHLPAERLVTLEPQERKKPPARFDKQFGNITVSALRTYHGHGHNSYLVEIDGVRIFHDADNEKTQPLDIEELGKIDVLLLCPWAESGSGDFVARVKPGKWLLIHLTETEIAQHRANSFLPGLISPVPEGVIALAGGEWVEI